MLYKNGDLVLASDTKVYPTYDSNTPSLIKTGKFFIFNSTIKNDRIRITDSKDKVNKPRMATGWVNLSEITPSNE